MALGAIIRSVLFLCHIISELIPKIILILFTNHNQVPHVNFSSKIIMEKGEGILFLKIKSC